MGLLVIHQIGIIEILDQHLPCTYEIFSYFPFGITFSIYKTVSTHDLPLTQIFDPFGDGGMSVCPLVGLYRPCTIISLRIMKASHQIW